MGTRSLTFIKEKHDKEYSINMYKQYDGYPKGYGLDLAKYLNKFTIVNGFSMNDKRTIANGVSCLIAQLVSNFKQEAGGIYIYLVPELPVKDTPTTSVSPVFFIYRNAKSALIELSTN